MTHTLHAMRLGLRRGLIEFGQSLRSSQDVTSTLVLAFLVVGYLYLRRNSDVAGSELLVPQVSMPSILGALIAYNGVIAATFMLSMAREDGTLLRAKTVPHGLRGYFTGLIVSQSLFMITQVLLVLAPCVLLFDDVAPGGLPGWATFALVVILGLCATLPIGMVLGALVPNTQKVLGWAMLPIFILIGISGIFYPVQELWGWLQVVAQIFPVYWLGLGMRSAFLPDSAAALEIAGDWRTLETLLVLGAWSVIGAVVAPMVLRRMARRQSASVVAAAREASMQWIR